MISPSKDIYYPKGTAKKQHKTPDITKKEASGKATMVIFIKKMTNNKLLAQIRAQAKNNALSIISHVRGNHQAVIYVLLAIAMDVAAPTTAQIPATAQVLHSATKITATLAITAVFLSRLYQSKPTADAIAQAIKPLASYAMLLYITLNLIRTFGAEIDRLLAWAVMNPSTIIPAAAGVIIVRLAFLIPLNPETAPQPQAQQHEAEEFAPVTNTPRRLDDEEIWHTAIHEAGHAMLFAALPNIPEDITATIKTEVAPQEPNIGIVNTAAIYRRTERWDYWLMLTKLAGAQAERAVFSDCHYGSSVDNEKWLAVAQDYLEAGFGEPYYSLPADDTQIAHNRMALDRLKQRQLQQLNAFMTTNKPILLNLGGTLRNNKTMDKDALQPYLSKVVVAKKMRPARRPEGN